MKHRVAKKKFGLGYDANKMLIRQLCTSFFLHNSLITTKQRIKAAQQHIERSVTKAKEKTEAHKNELLTLFGDEKVITTLFSVVGPAMKSISGGYTKMTLLRQRQSDGAIMAKLTWAHPIIREEKKEKKIDKEEMKKEKK